MITHISDGFKIACYRFVLKLTTSIKLPPYSGSSFRGAFSDAFKSLTCTFPGEKCELCIKQSDCPYFQIIENSDELSSLKLNRFRTPPKPFIIELPMQSKPEFLDAGQEFTLNLILFGKILNYFPYFVIAFKKLGKIGIDQKHGKYIIKQIDGINLVTQENKELYSFMNEEIINQNVAFNITDYLQQNQLKDKLLKNLVIEFVSPTRIKSTGAFGNPLGFKIFIQSILTRITNIAYSYCEQKKLLNFHDLVNQASKVEIRKDNKITNEKVLSPNSASMKMFLGGYLGKIVYQGDLNRVDLNQFWPWLKVGELIHVGKNCAFGLGKFTVTNVETTE